MPANGTHWSTRLMAEKTGLSQTATVRIWHAFGLQRVLSARMRRLELKPKKYWAVRHLFV
jgi:hypothetical protein